MQVDKKKEQFMSELKTATQYYCFYLDENGQFIDNILGIGINDLIVLLERIKISLILNPPTAVKH